MALKVPLDHLRDLLRWLRFLTTGRAPRIRRAYFRPSPMSDLDGRLMRYVNQVVTVRYVKGSGLDRGIAGQRLFQLTTRGAMPKFVRRERDFDFLD